MLIHTFWSLESDPEKGNRSTVRIKPTEQARRMGVRPRQLRGPWMNTGNPQRDEYLSSERLKERLAAIESLLK